MSLFDFFFTFGLMILGFTIVFITSIILLVKNKKLKKENEELRKQLNTTNR